MRILITGASGFLGKPLTRSLIARGHEVVALVRPGTQILENMKFGDRVFRIVERDLVGNFDLHDLEGIHAVITLAQERHFRQFPGDSIRVFDVNVRANLLIWRWAAQTEVSKIIHASSGSVYQPRNGLEALTEVDPIRILDPEDFYATSKVMAEQIFSLFRDQSRDLTILRPFFLYGPSQSADKLVGRLAKSIIEQSEISVSSSHETHLNPTFIEDAVKIFVDSLELRGHTTVNCAGPSVVSIRELATLIGAALGVSPRFKEICQSGNSYIGSVKKQSELFGPPKYTVEQGVRLCFQRSG